MWKWSIGASAAAGAAGAAAYNIVQTRRAEADNPPIGSFIEVDGVRLHYLERGEGPLVVLLHGNGTMVQDWLASGVMGELSANRVIAFDRPGFGHSDRPRTTVWTPEAQARLIAAALVAKGERQATIVGHSFGAMVAVALGLNHPEVVTSLVLIGGYYYPSARIDAALSAPPAIPLVGDAIRYTVSPLLARAMKRGMEAQIFAPARVSNGWESSFPFEMTVRPSQIRAAAADAAMMVPAAAALAKRLGELKMPVTIVAGRGDKVVDPSGQAERAASDVPQSELLLIENAGHMVHHTAPEQLGRAIKAAAGGASK